MKKSIKLISLLLVLVMAFSVIACQRPADKQEAPKTEEKKEEAATTTADGDVIEVKIGHTDSSQRSTHKWAVWLGEYLEEKAPGKFKVEVYPDGQLGDSPDLIAGVKLGTLQINFDLSSVVTAAAWKFFAKR